MTGTAPAPGRPSKGDYGRLADEAESVLRDDVLAKWFPAAVDPRGGFHQDFGEDWARLDRGSTRSLVYQSRLTWTSAEAVARFPDRAAFYRAINRHGIAFLRDRQWDRTRGGFFWTVDAEGRPVAPRPNEKHTYGMAFGIFAAATSCRATHDQDALDLAKKAFAWLHGHAHDSVHGGYSEALSLDATPIAGPLSGCDAIGTPYGLKSTNTQLHVLEALSALHLVWPDPTVRADLQEIFELLRDRAVTASRCLTQFFRPDWRGLASPHSYGHEVEAAYLLCEAARILGRQDDPATLRVARNLVDHALAFGYDGERGGFYNAGPLDSRYGDTRKIWWVQAEGLNALLLMHMRYGDETLGYWRRLVQTWNFVRSHQLDHKHGGWHPVVSAEGRPLSHAKSDGWTEAYHQARALLNVSRMLRSLAAAQDA